MDTPSQPVSPSSPTRQRIVIHDDDVGMCHGTNTAFAELCALGTISSGSVMVPCPWFLETAALARDNATLDVGVHLTLNAEKVHYRWRPVSSPPASAGLTDDSGMMWRSVADVRRHANPEAVEAEWRAQIDRALAAGIDVTHLDAHMGSALAPEWCDRYIALGIEYGLPALITATLADYGPNKHLSGTTEEQFAVFVDQARAARMPVFGRVLETDFSRARGAAVDYQALLSSSDADLVFCAFHPCALGPGEVEVIEQDSYHVRTDEHALFASLQWRAWLDEQPFEVSGMRVLRDEFRAALSAG